MVQETVLSHWLFRDALITIFIAFCDVLVVELIFQKYSTVETGYLYVILAIMVFTVNTFRKCDD